MKYLKLFEEQEGVFPRHQEFSEYQYYVAIYRCDCDSEDDMIFKANLVKNFLIVDYKICYIDPVFFPDFSECIVFLLKEKIKDIKFPYPTEGTANQQNHKFTIFVREIHNWDIMEKTEIPNNDIEQFFMAKKYNL